VSSRIALALTVLVAALVPPILAANGIRVLANDWFVRFEYGRLPPDAYGFTRAQRTELGLAGLHSILPGKGEGIGLLRRSRLPDGRRAFREKELRHMADVRRMIGFAYTAHLVALGAVAALALGLALTRQSRSIVPRGLLYGAALTLSIALAVALAVAIDADGFLSGFHRLFFAGDSWRFREMDTLRRLYPDRFWAETAGLLGIGAAAQAALLLAGGGLWRRRRQAIAKQRRTPLRAPGHPGS
jgi:hypothetical protein